MTIDELREEYRRWHVWASDSGHLYAARRTYLTEEQFEVGMQMTVDGANVDQLHTELLRQAAAEDRYHEYLLARS